MLKKLISAVAAISLCATSVCYAHTEASVIYSPSDGEISVSGNADGKVIIIVSPKELTPEDMSVSNLPLIVKQLTADGSFEYNVGIPSYAPGGKYNVYVNDITAGSFIHINSSDAEQILPKLMEADGDEFANLIEENASVLGIDTEDEVYISLKGSIVELLDCMKFDDIGDFSTKYAKVYAVTSLRNSDSEKAASVLYNYRKQLSVDYANDYENDARLDEDAKKELFGLIAKTDFKKLITNDGDFDFNAEFSSLKPVAVINSENSWIKIKDIICTEFADVFADVLSDSTYLSVRDKNAVFEDMTASYDDLPALKKAFLSSAQNVYSDENRPAGGGGGGGGSKSGGFSSSGGSVTVPPAQPETEVEEGISFNDMNTQHWAFKAVTSLCSQNIISGYPDGSFKPSDNITRAEFAKLIAGFLAEVSGEDSFEGFDDVKEDNWHYAYVNAAAKSGIVFGYGKMFRPDEYIKRQDAAVMIHRLLQKRGDNIKGNKIFADRDDISDYARSSVAALGEARIVSGSGSNMFLPQSNLTRAEAAQIIYNAIQKG